MIRVLIVDDHPVVRAGLARLMDSHEDITVVGTASDGAAAVSLDAALLPDVTIMDLSMPVVDGVVATGRILAARPEARILVVASSAEPDRILAAVDAGAVGYLLKDAEPDSLVDGVRAAARGESPLDPKAGRALMRDRSQRRRSVQLSEREIEILQLVARGLLNKQIARQLDIRETTVKAHLGRVFQRIGVATRADAAEWAAANGLLAPEVHPEE
jgi:DNA-binding NarL/FixJ family response regulator